jgi:hypothetical protein
MYQMTSSTPSGLAGYPQTNRPSSLASLRVTWTPWSTVRTTFLRLYPSRHSQALFHSPTAPHLCSISRTSPARWQH